MSKRDRRKKRQSNKRPKKERENTPKFYLGIWMKSSKSLNQNVSRLCWYIGTYFFCFLDSRYAVFGLHNFSTIYIKFLL